MLQSKLQNWPSLTNPMRKYTRIWEFNVKYKWTFVYSFNTDVRWLIRWKLYIFKSWLKSYWLNFACQNHIIRVSLIGNLRTFLNRLRNFLTLTVIYCLYSLNKIESNVLGLCTVYSFNILSVYAPWKYTYIPIDIISHPSRQCVHDSYIEKVNRVQTEYTWSRVKIGHGLF